MIPIQSRPSSMLHQYPNIGELKHTLEFDIGGGAESPTAPPGSYAYVLSGMRI